jgi:predicted O-methyltransferase YrrM
LNTAIDRSGALALIRTIVASLESIAGLEPIWKRGIVHRGGPHYRLSGTTGPVSIGEDECLLLGRLIGHFRPSNCFIIGNGFGLSSVFIARMMAANGGASVITLDNLTEGDGQRCFDTAEELRRRFECRILRNKRGHSPEDINHIVESPSYDFVFIDGDHSHPHVTNDCHAVQPLLRPNSIVCWHDYWLRGVSESVADAQRVGYHCLKVNSSSEMVFGTSDAVVFQEIAALFANAEAPIRRNHPLARLALSRSFVWGMMKSGLNPKEPANY